jgi:hypothetical protein
MFGISILPGKSKTIEMSTSLPYQSLARSGYLEFSVYLEYNNKHHESRTFRAYFKT